MRLRHIEIFNAVYMAGSISGAARLLNITQPTASKLLKHAEDQLGFLLFKRLKGRLLPTNEANRLFQETREIDKKIASLKKTTLNLQNFEQGNIRLAAVPALGIEFLPRAIVAYHKKFPQCLFDIQTHHYDTMLPALYEHDKDLAIALNPPQSPGIIQLDMSVGEFVCIYSGDEFDHHPDRLSLSDLEGKPFVSIEDSGPLFDIVAAEIDRTTIKGSVTVKAQTYFMARNLVALGAGISILDEYTARSKGAGTIKYKGFNPPLTFSVKALHLENKIPSKTCLNFITFFKEQILGKLAPLSA